MNFIQQKPSWECYHMCFPEINKGEENGIAHNKAIWWTGRCLNSGEDIGFYTLYQFAKQKTILYNFAVYDKFRGHGYGGIMLKHIINSLCDCKKFYLFVNKENGVACNLYKKHGFIESTDFVPPNGFITMVLNIK